MLKSLGCKITPWLPEKLIDLRKKSAKSVLWSRNDSEVISTYLLGVSVVYVQSVCFRLRISPLYAGKCFFVTENDCNIMAAKNIGMEECNHDNASLNERRVQFGNRYLTNPSEVYKHNAW